MSQTLMINLISLVLLVSALDLKAEEKIPQWTLEKPENPTENFNKVKHVVEKELNDIEVWKQQQGYPKSKIDNGLTPRNHGLISIKNYTKSFKKSQAGKRKSQRLAGDKLTQQEALEENTMASYGMLSNTMDIDGRELTDKKLESNELKHILAHESFHASQAEAGTHRNGVDWINEGLAEAVGFGWLENEKYKFDPSERDPKYDKKLATPDIDEAYSRGHFFYFLGKDLGVSMKYAGEITRNPARKSEGIQWLDSYLKTTKLNSLKEYYPKFINKHTNNTFFKDKDYPSLEITIPSVMEKKIKGSSVLAVASTYDALNVKFESIGWGSKEDKERIYLISIDVPKAEKEEDLSLIAYGKIKLGKERHLRMLFAEAGSLKKPVAVKVPNVAKIAADSKKQKFTLRLKASPVSFELPTCMQVGSKGKILLKGDISLTEFKSLENITLKVNGRKVNSNLQFTVPKSPQKANVTLTIQTISGKTKKIKLGTINVQSKTCGILMTSDGGELKMIWDSRKNITEVITDTSEVILFSDNVGYVYSPKEGWMQIDFNSPMIKSMSSMMGMPFLTNNGGMGSFLPNVLVKKFSWKNAQKGKRKSISCSKKSRSCKTNGIILKYDTSYRLTRFEEPGSGGFNLKYGNYSSRDLPTKFSKMPGMPKIPAIPNMPKGMPKNTRQMREMMQQMQKKYSK